MPAVPTPPPHEASDEDPGTPPGAHEPRPGLGVGRRVGARLRGWELILVAVAIVVVIAAVVGGMR